MIDPEGPLSYVIFVVLLLLSGFFSSTESALSYCNRHRIKVKADDGSKAAKLLVKVFDKFDDTIVTILIGNNIVIGMFDRDAKDAINKRIRGDKDGFRSN